jgi:hypothetical protein
MIDEFRENVVKSEWYATLRSLTKSQKAYLLTIILFLADYVFCQLATMGCFYGMVFVTLDNALPAVISDTVFHVDALTATVRGDISIKWTVYRNFFFWTSALFRIFAVTELGLRCFTSSDLNDMFTDPIEIFDALCVTALFFMRFALPFRPSVIYNNLVILRMPRLYKYILIEIERMNDGGMYI